MDIVTVQSRVTWGYVGNAVAVPVLQALGINAWPIDTVRLSHHPGHGIPCREDAETSTLLGLFEGARGKSKTSTGVLLGYLGNAEQGSAIVDRITRDRATETDTHLYLDPAFGDDPGGTYVDVRIVDFYRTIGIKHASVLMPNRYELATLSGHKVKSVSDAVEASRMLIASGCGCVMASSIPSSDDMIANIFVDNDISLICETKRVPLHAKGTGDMLSAAFCGLHSAGRPVGECLGMASAIVQSACAHASANGLTELNLIDLLRQIHLGVEALPIQQHP